jgi:hypothetical protein
MAAPCFVCVTSGWNCTAKNRRMGSAIPAMAHASLSAMALNPGGNSVTLSPWLIHTSRKPCPSALRRSSMPAKSFECPRARTSA